MLCHIVVSKAKNICQAENTKGLRDEGQKISQEYSNSYLAVLHQLYESFFAILEDWNQGLQYYPVSPGARHTIPYGTVQF